MSLQQDLERRALRFAQQRGDKGSSAEMMAAFADELLREQARRTSDLWDQAFKTKELLETADVAFDNDFRVFLAQQLNQVLAPRNDPGDAELEIVGDESSAGIVPKQRDQVVYRPGQPFRQEVRGPDVALHTVFPVVEYLPGGLRVRALAVEETAQKQIVSALNALAYSPIASRIASVTTYLIVGVDQDGDPNWDVCLRLSAAAERKVEMDEISHAPNKVYCIQTGEDLIVSEVDQAELDAALPPEMNAPAP